MDRSRFNNGRRAPRGRPASHPSNANPASLGTPAFDSASAEAEAVLRRKRERGFTLLEVVIAIAIMATGLIAVAALVATSAYGTERSRYMSMASTLASEKIEDLMRYPSADAQVTVPAGSTCPGVTEAGGVACVGSLSSPVSQSITADATTTTVYYYDDVYISASAGQETNGGAITTVTQTAAGYCVFNHQPNGTASETCGATAPALSGSDLLTFHRSWIIESPVIINGNTINGIRRITVWVKLMNSYENPPVTFQVSIVRP